MLMNPQEISLIQIPIQILVEGKVYLEGEPLTDNSGNNLVVCYMTCNPGRGKMICPAGGMFSSITVIPQSAAVNTTADIKAPIKNATSDDKPSVSDNRSKIEKIALKVIFVIFGIVLFLALFGRFFGLGRL